MFLWMDKYKFLQSKVIYFLDVLPYYLLFCKMLLLFLLLDILVLEKGTCIFQQQL
uniref:Hypotheticial protein n=1 Tax=Schistosoma japonicum TaxID=6182 RepID=C1LFD6_SCHJA|nr:hypotheticial protein [Schistosoma japonicum]